MWTRTTTWRACFERVAILRPQSTTTDGPSWQRRRAAPTPVPELHANLAGTLDAAGRIEDAVQEYRRVIQLAPGRASVHNDLGLLLHALGELDAAQDCLAQAIRLEPGFALAHANLATILKDQGDIHLAYLHARSAVQADPALFLGWVNLLFALPYLSDVLPADEVRDVYSAFGNAIGPVPPRRSTQQPRDAKLRIGYVSADFRDHAVTYFFEPVVERHDRGRFDVVFYDLTQEPDEVNERLRQYGGATWVDAAAFDDVELCRRIAADDIDILVDLMGHTAGNRLLAFASRPAPIQVNWLGWPSTTGLAAMDYVVSDPYVDADAASPLKGPEKVIHLSSTWVCYRPDNTAPDPAPDPSAAGCPPTFGSFTGIHKIGDRAAKAWAELLLRIPSARLLIAGVPPGRAHQRLLDRFSALGIDPQRLVLRAPDSLGHFFAWHADVDVALDTFPFNGCTTTLHSLWMGVPVVSVAGNTHAGRMGLSILRNLGLDDLVADDVGSYIDKAAELVVDRPRLELLRRSLRDRLRASPLMDEAGFVAKFESTLYAIAGGKQ